MRHLAVVMIHFSLQFVLMTISGCAPAASQLKDANVRPAGATYTFLIYVEEGQVYQVYRELHEASQTILNRDQCRKGIAPYRVIPKVELEPALTKLIGFEGYADLVGQLKMLQKELDVLRATLRAAGENPRIEQVRQLDGLQKKHASLLRNKRIIDTILAAVDDASNKASFLAPGPEASMLLEIFKDRVWQNGYPLQTLSQEQQQYFRNILHFRYEWLQNGTPLTYEQAARGCIAAGGMLPLDLSDFFKFHSIARFSGDLSNQHIHTRLAKTWLALAFEPSTDIFYDGGTLPTVDPAHIFDTTTQQFGLFDGGVDLIDRSNSVKFPALCLLPNGRNFQDLLDQDIIARSTFENYLAYLGILRCGVSVTYVAKTPSGEIKTEEGHGITYSSREQDAQATLDRWIAIYAAELKDFRTTGPMSCSRLFPE